MKRVILAAIFGCAGYGQAFAQTTPADWSGWWGGLSIGGSQVRQSNREGAVFCVAGTENARASASTSCSAREGGGARFELSDGETQADAYMPLDGSFNANISTGPDYEISQYFPESPGNFALTELVAPNDEGPNSSLWGILGLYDTVDLPGIDVGAFALGGHLRRDWQFANGLVTGLEAEAAWLSADDQGWSRRVHPLNPIDVNVSLVSRTDALGSVRARMGYATGNLLPYVTAGIGFANMRAETTSSVDYSSQFPSVSDTRSEQKSTLAVAPVLGGGISWMVTDGIAVSGEGLYYFFDEQMSFSNGQSVSVDGAWSAMLKVSLRIQ